MAEITATMVKELRARTGAGMMDCKKALTDTGGELEAAVDWLRKKGLAAAAKKSGRVAAEGLIGVAGASAKGAMIEINSETDFVARNAQFQEFVANLAILALSVDGDLGALSAAPYPGSGRSVAEETTHLIATIGENISIRRAAAIAVGQGIVGSYVHAAVGEGLGKIGVLVGLESTADSAALAPLAKHLAMHIAATAPQALTVESLDPAAVEREKAVLSEQARASRKPEAIIEKMVEGRLRKFYEEVVLMKQTSVVDPDHRIEEVVAAAAREAGAPISVTGFARFALGEGIEKKGSDFAAEVQAAVGA